MPQIIDVEGVGQLEFPDEMGDDQIAEAIQKNFGSTSESRGPEILKGPEPGIEWGRKEGDAIIEKMRRDEEMRKAVGGMYQPGTELTGAMANTLHAAGLIPSSQREKSVGERVAERRTQFDNPEKAALEQERLTLQEEGVPMGWRMAAAAHSGLSKGLQLPSTLIQSGIRLGRMMPGLDIGESMYRGINRDVFGNYLPDVAKENDEYFKNLAKWENWMSEKDAMLGPPSFMTQLAEGTARGFAELPAQMLGGASGVGEAAAMRGAAIGAGVVSGAQNFAQELGEGSSDWTALTRGATSGLITGVTTKAFGATGVESILRKEGVEGVANKIKHVLIEAGWEGVEEATDQLQQELANWINKNPDKPLSSSINDIVMAGAVGTLLGGGIGGVGAVANRNEPGQPLKMPMQIEGGEQHARQISEAAKVHGNVRARQGQAAQQVPAQEGGPGVQSQTQGRVLTRDEQIAQLENDPYVTGKKLVSMDAQGNPVYEPQVQNMRKVRELERLKQEKADDEAYEKAEKEGMDQSAKLLQDAISQENAGGMVELGDLSTTEGDGDQPFHNRLAIWDTKSGKIIVDPVAWHAEMQAHPEAKRAQLARTIMNEEMTHVATTKKEARRFFALSTKAEQAIARRIYTGKWGDTDFSDTEIGYEMIRRRVQRINRMTITELLNQSRSERWSVHSWQLLEDIIRTSRQQIANRGGGKKQLAIIDNVLNKVGQVRQMAEAESGAGGERKGPAAIARSAKVEDLVKRVQADEKFNDNTQALEAGLSAESIDDLEALRSAKKQALSDSKKARLDEAKANALGKPDEAKVAADRKISKGVLNQFLREAIESATSTGSHRVEMRRFGETKLPMPKLDWKKNPEVKAWLEQHGEELGISLPEEQSGPAALSRAAEKRIAKLREKREAEIAASERGELPLEQVNEKIIALSNKQRESNLTENEQEELRELRRMRYEREEDMFGPSAIRRNKTVFEQMQEQKSKYKPGQKMTKEDLEDHGVAVDKTPYDVDEKNELREKFSQRNNEFAIKEEVRDMVETLSPAQQKFIQKHWPGWRSEPEDIVTAYNHYKNLKERGKHISDTEKRLLWALRDFNSDLISYGAVVGYTGNLEPEHMNIARIAHAFHEELMDLGVQDPRRPNELVHPKTIVENWKDYRVQAWKEHPELASLIDEKIYKKYQVPKHMSEEEWDAYEFQYDELGNAIDPTETHEVLSPDEEMKDHLEAYYKEHGGKPPLRKPYKERPTHIPTRDDGQEEFKLEGPAARRRNMTQREARLEEQRRRIMQMKAEAAGEEFPEELKHKQPSSAYPAVAPEERVGASESGALPRLTNEDIAAQAVDILGGEIKIKYRAKSAETLAKDVARSTAREEAGTGRTGDFGVSAGRSVATYPNFKEFAKWAKGNSGGVEAHKLREIWEDSVWGTLLKATPERLDEWRKALGLEKKYGKSVLYEEANAAKQQEFKKRTEDPDLTIQGRLQAQRERLSVEASQRYRQKVINAIAYKLVGESMDDRPSLDRKDVHLEDIDFGNANADFSPYHEFSADEISNPDVLKKVLRDEARASNTDPESASRRLVVVVNRATGKVEMLSTYNDNGVQRVVDPAGARLPKKPHRELNGGFLRQYRPIGSLLLKDPVRAFRRQYDSVSEFNNRLGAEAHERSTVGENLQTGVADFKAEGTPGIEGEGGYLIGKHKATSGIEISRPGSMESDTALSQPEVERMVDAVWDEVGQFDDPSDVRMMVKALEERAKVGKVSASDRMVVSAFRKIHNQISRENPNIVNEIAKENPDWTGEKVRKAADEALLDDMADRIFELSETSESRGQLLKAMMRAFEGMTSQAETPTEAKSKFSKELTMPIERRPPTEVSPEQLPPGVEPVVGKEKERPVQRLRYQPAEEEEPTPVPKTEGEKVAERAESMRHKEREREMNRIWDEAINEPMRTEESKRQLAQRVRQEIYQKTKVLLTMQQAMDALTNKTGTPEERVVASSEKIERAMTREQMIAAIGVLSEAPPPARKPGEVWTSRKRVHPSLRVRGEGSEGPAAIRRSTGKETMPEIFSNILHDLGSSYDAWMTDRVDEYGGEKAKEFARAARKIIDRKKQVYGGLTALLDRARKLAGGVEPAKHSLLSPVEYAKEVPGRVKSSIDAQRAVAWMNGLMNITPKAAVARVVRAIEGTLAVPDYAENLTEASQAANKEIGAVLEPVTVRGKKKKKYKAHGSFQRNMTSLGYDIMRAGGGEQWEDWTHAVAEANKHAKGVTLDSVQRYFKNVKSILDDPMTSSDVLERINQDIARRYPRVVTHLKINGMWEPVIHSDLFNYLENAAQRASHIRAFRETFPATKEGKTQFKDFIKEVKRELTSEVVDDVDDLIRAMHGHPTDSYNDKTLKKLRLEPQQFWGKAMRLANQTVNNLLGKTVLTGQMAVQPGEVAAGSTPVFLGYHNYLKAMARYRQLYKLLEMEGARNPVMHDYTFNPMSPVRSSFKIAGNVISKVSMQNMLNELQEGLAAATARVVAENIKTGNLTEWDKSMLPQTFKAMGFSKPEILSMMRDRDTQLLDQFQRKAAAFLTGGNKDVTEGSSLGSTRLFNSIFRFQTYPMIKMNQTRKIVTNWVDAMRTGRPEEKWAATRMAGRFLFGNAMQGALTVGLTSLAFGGMSGLKIRMKEAEDEPFTFLAEAILSSISGPAYLLWRSKSFKGPIGFGEQAARLMFPYAVMKDMMDMAYGFGQYKDRPLMQKIGMFLKNKTPGTKMIGTGLAAFGLSQQNQQLDEAIKGLSRWRRDNLGFTETQAYLAEDYRKNFRIKMKQAIDAMKVGDQDKFMESWIAALEDEELTKRWMENPDGPDIPTRISMSFKARKMLVDPSGAELSEENKEALRKHIGNDAYDALEYYDLMLEQAADGVLLPRADR